MSGEHEMMACRPTRGRPRTPRRTALGGARLDLPRSIPNVEQVKPVRNLIGRERVQQVLLVGQHQQGHARHLLLLQKLAQLVASLLQTLKAEGCGAGRGGGRGR